MRSALKDINNSEIYKTKLIASNIKLIENSVKGRLVDDPKVKRRALIINKQLIIIKTIVVTNK